jgi:hypothetical protein
MNPVHHRSFVAMSDLCPLRGIALPTADYVQRLKAFPAALGFSFNDNSSDSFDALVPFGEIWL